MPQKVRFIWDNVKDHNRFTGQIEALRQTYSKMFRIYQKSKEKEAEVLLK
jgi:hypothetical protein